MLEKSRRPFSMKRYQLPSSPKHITPLRAGFFYVKAWAQRSTGYAIIIILI
jgi:hypothetical protein